MSEAVIVSIISGIVSLASLLMTLLIKGKQNEITKSQTDLEHNQGDLHTQINSRMDELLKLTRESGKQEGKDQEQSDEKDRKKWIK